MRKIKNIFINLLGAAVIAACSASTALAQWSTADYGGKNVTGEVFADRNSVYFLPAPGGNANVVWTKYVDPLTYGVAAQQLANADGSYVWASTASVAASVSMGENTGPDNSEANPDGSGGLLVKYVDEVSSNCYITDLDPSGALRPSWTLNPVMINSDPVVGCNMVPVLGGEAFGFVIISTAVEGELPGSFIRAFNLNDGTVLAPFSSGNGVAVGTAPYIAIPSPAGAGQTYPGAIFLSLSDDQQTFTAFRVDSEGAINWSVSYSTVANTNNISLLPDGASGAYIVWSDIVTQHLKAIRINASGVQYPAWEYNIYANMYLNSNHGGSGDTGAWYALSTASGVVVAWAEDVATNAEIRAALLKEDGSGIAWNKAVDTLLQGTGLNMDGSNLTISSTTAGTVAIAYQYGNEFKALNAAVLNIDGQTMVAGHAVMSGFPSNVANHDAFAVNANNDFIVGVMIDSSIYAQKITVPAAPAGAGFTGDFASPGGSNFDGGMADYGQGADFYNGSLYTVGQAAGVGGVIVKYDEAGVVVSSAVLPGVGPTDVKVNANGVYIAAQGDGTGFVTAKYTLELNFVSSATLPGDSSARDLALDGAGNVYVIGSNWGEAGSLNDYKIAKYDLNLAYSSSSLYNAGGLDEGRGIAAKGSYLYVTGTSLQGNTTYFTTVKLFASDLSYAMLSHEYSGPAYVDAEHPMGSKIVANQFADEIYVVASSSHNKILTLKYDSTMAPLASAEFSAQSYAQGSDINLDTTGNVYVVGSYQDPGYKDTPVVLKYNNTLVFQSSVAVQHAYGFEPMAMGLDPAAGNSYVTGVYFANGSEVEDDWDMRTVKFAGLPDAAAPAMRQISGTAVYTGPIDPAAQLTVWVSTSPDFRGTPYFAAYSPSFPQAFTISNVPAGVYYLAMTGSIDWAVADSTDPWGVYGQLGTPEPINVVSADVSALSVTLTDGNQIPNPFSPEGQSASVNCAAVFATGGDCRINGRTTFATGLLADASDNKYLLLTNLTDSAIVKFDNFGDIVSSVTVKYAVFNDIKTNSNNGDFYVAAQGPVSGIRVFRYTTGLAFVSSYTAAGYQGARQLDFDAQGNVYAVSTIDNSGDYDIRVVKLAEDLSSQLDDWSEISAGPDQGYGIDVEGTDVFVAGIQRPGSDDEVVVMRLDATSSLTKADWGYPALIPVTFQEGQGYNNIRVAADSGNLFAAYSSLVETSTLTVIFHYGSSNLSAQLSSAAMAGAYNFGDMKMSGTNFYVAAQSDMNQARVTKYAAATFEPMSSQVAFVPMPYGMAPGALAFGVASEVYLAGVIPDGSGGLSGGVGAISAVDGPVPTDAPEYVQGTSGLETVPDGTGGAYMVWDSTMAPGGLRMVFAKHVDSSGAELWGPVAVSTFPADSDDSYAIADGGNLIVGYFSEGHGYAQRYLPGTAAPQWGSGSPVAPIKVTTGPVDGGEFIANPAGGAFMLFGYLQGGEDFSMVAQRLGSDGLCQWPSSGDCLTSAGTPVPVVDAYGEIAGAAGSDGSLMLFWGGDFDFNGFMQVSGAKLNANGTFNSPAWSPKSLYTAASDQLGADLEAVADDAGGAYLVWSSSAAGAKSLYSGRVNADGTLAWASPVQLTEATMPVEQERGIHISAAKDEAGFTVMYSSNSWNFNNEVRIARALADGSGLAPGFPLGGKSLGVNIDGVYDLVYDGSAYHIVYNPWESIPGGNYHRVGYQKMSKEGDFLFSPYYSAGVSSDCLHVSISTDGAGGALVSWIEAGQQSGGNTYQPKLVSIPLGTGGSLGNYTGDFSQPAGAVYDSGYQDWVNGIAIDNVSAMGPYIYTVGATSNTATGGVEGIIIKYDSAGQKLASDKLVRTDGNKTAQFLAASVDASGNVLVTGYSSGIPVIKYDPSLNVIVSTMTPGNDGFAVTTDLDGNIIMVGGNGGFDQDWLIRKFDSGLNQLNELIFDGGQMLGTEYGRAVVTDASRNIYVAGKIAFSDHSEWSLKKFDSALNFISEVTLPISLSQGAWANLNLILDNDGNLVVAGGNSEGYGGSGLLAKYNQSLVLLSSAATGGETGLAGKVGASNEITALSNDMIVQYDSALTPLSYVRASEGRDLVLDNSGNAYSAWDEWSETGDIHTVKYDLSSPFPPHGKGTEEFAIKETSLEDSGGFSAYGAGKFLTAYQHNGSNITARLMDSAGTPVGSEITFDPVTEYGSGAWPHVSFDGTNFLVAWACDIEGYRGRIRGHLVDPAGAKIGAGFWVNSTGSDEFQLDGVRFDGSNYFVVWSSSDTGIPGNRSSLYGQFVDPAGALVGAKLTIAANAKDSGFAYSGGKYLSAWRDDDGNYGTVVRGRFVLPEQTFGGDAFVIDHSAYASDNPVAVAGGSDKFLVAFHDQLGVPDSDSFRVYGKFVGLDGTVAVSTFAFTDAPGSQFFASPVWDGSRYLVTWNNSVNTSTASVHLRYFGPDGAPLDADTVIAGPEYGKIPFALSTAYDGANSKLLVAINRDFSSDFDSPTTDLYGLLVATTPAVVVGAGFTGDFSSATGSGFDLGANDRGMDVAFYGGNVYAAGVSENLGGLVFKYDNAGVLVASATLPGVYPLGIAVNANGVYVAGQGDGTGFVTAKYGHDLVVSSVAVLPGDSSAREIALDAAGNVYVIGSNWGEGGSNDYKVAKYDAALNQVGSAALFDAGGFDEGRGIAVDNGYVYVTGTSYLANGATSYALAKLDQNTMAWVSSASFANAYAEYPALNRLAVNPVTHDVYMAGTVGTESYRQLAVARYAADLNPLGADVFANQPYGLGMDVKLDAVGNVYALGKNYDGSYERTFVAKYAPNLVFLSSAVSAGAFDLNGFALDLDPATGISYVTGVQGKETEDMATFRFAALPGGIAPAGTFSGDFTTASVYAGPEYDYARSLAVNPANGDVYVTIVSSVAGNDQGLVVRYTSSGGMSSSATLAGANGFSVGGVALNANGVYVSGEVSGAGALLRYDADLGLVSSTTLAGVYDPGVGIDEAGSVYLAGGNGSGWTLARYDADLSASASSADLSFGAEVLQTRVWDLAADNGYLYAVGENWLEGSAYYLTAKFDAATLAFVSSATYANESGELEVNAGIAVNANTHDVYVGLTGGMVEDRRIVTLRYSQDLSLLGQALYDGNYSEMGHDVIVGPDGYVYTLGKDNDSYDYPVVLKYSPSLVFIASGSYAAAGLHSEGNSLAMNNATGNLYVAGFKNADGGGALDPTSDAATVRLAPIGGALPVVYISSADVSPAFYLAGQEAAALKLVPYTLTGEVGVSGLYIDVNPGGAYSDIASAGLYSDGNGDGLWDYSDTLVSSGAVTGAAHFFDFSGLGAVINTAQDAIFVTLTPAISAEGSNISVSVPSSGSFVTEGDMAQQAIYPIAAQPKLVNYLAAVSDLATDPGASLEAVNLYWTYPQDIASGHYIIRYSTNPADLTDPNVFNAKTATEAVSGVIANSGGFAPLSGIPLITSGVRVFPQYFAVWLFNGTSTSSVSNLAQNLYFPAMTAAAGDAVLNRRRGMYSGFEAGAKFARVSPEAGAYSALTFNSESRTFLALNAPDGSTRFYYDETTPLALKDLAADPAGNAYALVQRGTDAAAVKFAPDGSVAWNYVLSPSPETAKAIAWGGGAVYIATELENGSNSQDMHLYKLLDSNGSPVTDFIYDTGYLYGAGSYDEVNSLAFTSDPSGAYLYAAGVSGTSQMAGTLHKFADSGAVISTVSTGNWPVRHNNPSGDYSRALAVKADLNGNLLVAGAEQRYDLNQGANIWLNKYNAYGSSLFSVPARYNNPQSNGDDVPAALDFDQFGNIYASGYTDMWNLGQGYNMLLAKFAPGGQFQSARVYDGGGYDMGMGVMVSTDNYAHVAGSFGGDNYFGVYSMPIGGAAANVQFFSAMEGPHTGSVDLMWNYTGRLPAGSTYYIQYSADAAPVWNRASAQISSAVGPEFPGAVQSRRVGALPTLRYPGQEGTENRGNLYKFKVWITSAGLTTELPEARTFARTPNAFDNTRYFGFERLSFMSGLSMPPNAITVDGAYVYHAFAGRADGANAGFGLRKYDTGQYLEWTKFFNHRDDRSYQIGTSTRDTAGNFYLVGTQYPYNNIVTGPELMVAGKDSWIAKLNPAGNLVWSYASDLSGLGRMDQLYDAAVEGDYLYAVGAASTSANGMNVLALKYDLRPSTGPSQVWSYTLNGSANGDDFGYGIAVGTGAVYLSGTLQNATKDMFLRALGKADGLPVGDLIVNDSGFADEGYDLAITTTTPPYLYLGGSLGKLEDIGGTLYERSDAAVLQYTPDGTLVRTHTHNGKEKMDDAIYAVQADASGVIAAGYEGSSIEGKNTIVRRFDHSGNTVWSRGFNLVDETGPGDAPTYGDDEAYGLALGADGRVYAAVALWGNNPGFYYFPEPNFGVTAQPGYVPGSVRLQWMSSVNLQANSAFLVQYSTFSEVAWSSAAAQVRLVTDYDIYEGMSVDRAVYGLNSGRDNTGASTGPLYYFKIWAEPYFQALVGSAPPPGGAAPAPARAESYPAELVSDVPAAARAGEGWAFENMVMYPNEAKLFVMGSGQQYYYDSGEQEFPGIARDLSGNLYTLANMDWNGSGGFAVKKFNSVLMPLWTRYYAPGEGYQVKANRMAVDAAGSLYLTGTERAPAAGTGKDLFVLKMNQDGVAWKTSYDFSNGDDAGYGVAVDASGNVYAAGSAYNGSDDDILLAKFDSAGQLVNSNTYAGTGTGNDSAYGIAVQGGNVYAAGSSFETAGGRQFWMGKYQAADLAAVATYATGNDLDGTQAEAAFDVALNNAGTAVYFAGQLYSPESYSLDAAVRKSAADLMTAVSTFTYNSQANGVDSVRGIALDASGAVYAAGYTERYDINQDKNLWLRKYTADGSELWTQEFHANTLPGDTYAMGPTSDQGYSLAVGTMGFVSVSGRFNAYNGLYRYKQTSVLAVNPTLTVNVSSAAAGTPFPGVDVILIPFSSTGGIDVSGSTRAITNASGTVSFQVPAGKQYFIALDKQGYNPGIKDQQMDPYGNFFVQLNADVTKNYTLSPRSAATPYYPLTVLVSSAAQNDYLVAEVFFTQTGEKAAYGIGRVPAGVTATTMTITNLPPAAAGAYTLGMTIPNRGLAKSVVMSHVFPTTATYSVTMSTLAGAVATTGGFEVGASTTPPSVEGVVRNSRNWAPIEQVRVRLFNRLEPCFGGMCEYNSLETLTDVNGKFSFYNVTSTAAAYNLIAQKAGYKRAGFGGVSVTTGSVRAEYREFQLQEATYTLRGYIRYRDVPVPNAEVMVWGDYDWYGGSDSYKNGYGMDTDARTKTAADGSFLFSTATANGLPDGQVRMNAAFFGNWMDLNEGNTKDFTLRDADDVRIVISSGNATGVPNSNCTKGRVWKLNAQTGACLSLASGEINFNIMPPSQNDYAVMSGSVTFVTTFTVTQDNPLIISSMAPITVMAQQECRGDCGGNMSMGFAVISGTYTVNYATYSITLSTGVSYYTRVTSNEWGEVSSFNDRADFRSTMTTSVRMNFTVTKAGKLTGVVKMPDGSNYKPVYGSGMDDPTRHKMDINVSGQNVSVSEGWNVDDYGAFEFPNLAPGLYTITMRPEGEGFRWAAPSVRDIAVVAGKTTQVTLKLENGLYVQPQIIGLPDISTPTWHYVMLPVPTGTEMNQAKITDMFFGEDIFAFDYSTTTQTWDKKIMQVGQYDFYLMMVARYEPEGGDYEAVSFDQFGNFIGKVKAYNVQRNDSTPNLGTEFQPLPVNVLGSLGQDTFEGTIAGERLYTDADLDRIFSNMDELFPVIPSVMLYDAAGDLRGYTAGMPSQEDFPAFWAALGLKDKAQMRDYFADNLGRFMVPGLPPGRYTVVFNNPNYPPVAKEIDIPLAAAYPFDFDEQNIRVGTVHGTVRSTAPVSGAYPALDNAVVYLKHKTVEKFTKTAADGSFRFENLPPGIYRLEVTREGFVKAGGKTSLAGYDSSRLDFYLTPSQTSMTGKVYLSKFPAPVTKSGVKVVAYDETFNVEYPTEYLPKIEATTNDSGEYELPGVVPGHNYKVTAFLGGKQPAMLDVSSETVTEGVTYLPDIVLRDVPPQIKVKVRKSPDSVNKADVTIKSPKALVTTPVCKVNPGELYVATSAVSLALVPGPNNTYQGQFIISLHQPYYNVYVAAGDGSNRMEKSVTFSPNNQAKTEQYIQDEAIKGGEVQMDKESEEYSGIELDTGGLYYSTFSASGSGISAFRTSADGNLVGGFFSALPSVRTVKTAKGDLSLTQAITDLMASEIYNMELQNASANKPFTLTLKYDKEKAVDGANLRIYQYDEATDGWNEVPGNYTTDPMLGVLSVGVASLSGASEGASAASTPLGRKRMGMSAVVNGRYAPSAGGSSSSGRFAVFTARPAPSVPYASADYEVANLPNPFNLKDKTVTGIEGGLAAFGAATYTTRGTLIKYHLPPGKSGSVKFVIYNLVGEKVRTISDGVRDGGNMYWSEWDGRNDTNQDVASGVYFMLTYVNGEKLGTKAHKLAVIK